MLAETLPYTDGLTNTTMHCNLFVFKAACALCEADGLNPHATVMHYNKIMKAWESRVPRIISVLNSNYTNPQPKINSDTLPI